MAPGAKKPKPVAADTPRAAARQRLNEQQFLIENMDLLCLPEIASPSWNKKKKDANKTFKHIIPLVLPSAKIMNTLNKSLGAETFLNATSQEFSALVPSIKLYMPMSDGSPNGKLKDELLYFGNYIKAGDKVEYSRGDKKGITPESFLESAKGRSVGLKSFVYEQHTNHPGEKSMTASVEIFFQSISDLTSGPYVEMLVPILNPDSPKPSLAKNASGNDKAQRINELKVEEAAIKASIGKKGDSKDKVHIPATRMKAIIGWSTSISPAQAAGRSAKRLEALHGFLKSSQEVIVLEMTKYNLTFGAEGQATLKIDYVARSDNAFSGPGYNILTAGKTQRVNLSYDQLLGKDPKIAAKLHHDSYIRATLERVISDETKNKVKGPAFWSSLITTNVISFTPHKAMLDIDLHRVALEIAQLGDDDAAIKKAVGALETSKLIAGNVAAAAKGNLYGAFLKELNESNKIFLQTIPASYLGIHQDATDPDKQTVGARRVTLDETRRTWLKPYTDHGRAKRAKGAIIGTVIRASAEGDSEARKKLISGVRSGLLSATAGYTWAGMPVTYIFLGDLLDVAYDLTTNGGGASKKSKGTAEKNIMLGNFTLPPLLSGIGSREYNIADIPISLKSFQSFFLDKVVKPQRLTYPFREFTKDVLKLIVEPALNTEGLLVPREPVNQTGYTFFLSNFTSLAKFSKGEGYYENSPAIANLAKSRSMPEIRDQADYSDNLIILSREGFNGAGNYDEDLGKGIYHLVLGADRGPVKSFSFTQQENKYMHAINMAGASTGNKISVMAIPQDATITLVGTTLFKQGSLIFINAEFSMGKEVAKKLKIGGYYLVAKVTHELSADKYNTKLKCIWQNDYQHKPKSKTGGVKSTKG